MLLVVADPSTAMPTAIKAVPARSTGMRPCRSLTRPAKKRIEMELTTMMVLKDPLYTYPKWSTKSGVIVR